MYRAHAPAVLGYLRSQHVPDPEGLLGEVFLQVARSLHRFRGDEGDLRRWVITIARNRVVDDHRRRRRRPSTTGPVPDRAAPPDEDALDEDLVAALGDLTYEQREVVVLRFVADLSLDEVARVTGRSTGAVKAMQHRALAQLARILGSAHGAVEGDGRPRP